MAQREENWRRLVYEGKVFVNILLCDLGKYAYICFCIISNTLHTCMYVSVSV